MHMTQIRSIIRALIIRFHFLKRDLTGVSCDARGVKANYESKIPFRPCATHALALPLFWNVVSRGQPRCGCAF